MTTNFPSSQFKEEHSMQRPPLFDRSNYNYLKCRMKIYLQAIKYEFWNIVEAAFEKPHTNYNQWNNKQKKSINLDANAMNALFCALNKEEFNYMSTTTSAHQIWQTLQVTHEGTNKVKELKFLFLCTSSKYSKRTRMKPSQR